MSGRRALGAALCVLGAGLVLGTLLRADCACVCGCEAPKGVFSMLRSGPPAESPDCAGPYAAWKAAQEKLCAREGVVPGAWPPAPPPLQALRAALIRARDPGTGAKPGDALCVVGVVLFIYGALVAALGGGPPDAPKQRAATTFQAEAPAEPEAEAPAEPEAPPPAEQPAAQTAEPAEEPSEESSAVKEPAAESSVPATPGAKAHAYEGGEPLSPEKNEPAAPAPSGSSHTIQMEIIKIELEKPPSDKAVVKYALHTGGRSVKKERSFMTWKGKVGTPTSPKAEFVVSKDSVGGGDEIVLSVGEPAVFGRRSYIANTAIYVKDILRLKTSVLEQKTFPLFKIARPGATPNEVGSVTLSFTVL